MPIVAWYMLSKESYMNRVIKEVLPTVTSIMLVRSCSQTSGQQSEGIVRGTTYHFALPRRPTCSHLY